jgi:amidophosphoribosyltransferase
MMGVDMGSPSDLVANLVPREAMAAWCGADSLAYLSLESAGRALGGLDDYCAACFSGDYPLETGSSCSKERFEF